MPVLSDSPAREREQPAPGLGARAKALLVTGLILFFAIDHYHMWAARDNFPFCSHGLFNDLFQAETSLVYFVVHDSQGNSAIVDTGRVVPIEWYRAVGLVDNALIQEGDARNKQRIARLLLERLNAQPWDAFDETYGSIRPAPGARMIGLDVVVLAFDLDRYRHGQPLQPLRVERVFSYRLPEAPDVAAD